jgi:hypothetical protein
MSKEQGPRQPSLQLSPRGGESNRSPLPLGEGWGRGFAWVRLTVNNLGCRHSGSKTCRALSGGSVMSKEATS